MSAEVGEATPPTSLAWLDKVELSAPDPAGRIVVSTLEGPVLRLPELLGALLAEVKRHPGADLAEVAASAGLSSGELGVVLARIAATPSIQAAPSRLRRVQYRSPLTVQFTLLDPSKMLKRDGRLVRLLRTDAAWWSLLSAAVIGTLAAAWLALWQSSPLHARLSLGQYSLLLPAFLISIFVHEFAHAAFLTTYGGTSRRMGFMVFYLAPAFFCDVRDAWSLTPRERLRVAAAGVLAQGALAAGFGVAALALPGAGATFCAVMCVLNSGYVLLNLLPFIKLDGYVGLVGIRDRPHLRDEAVAGAADWLEHLLYGTRRRHAPSARMLVYGLLCLLTPLVIVAGAALGAGSALMALGRVALWAEGAVLLVLFVWAARRLVAHCKRVWGSAPRLRVAATWLVGVATLVSLALTVPVPRTATGGVVRVNGELVFMTLSSARTLDSGDGVTMRDPGIAPGGIVGTTTSTGAAAPCRVPLHAVVAVEPTRFDLGGVCLPLIPTREVAARLTDPQVALQASVELQPRTVAELAIAAWRELRLW